MLEIVALKCFELCLHLGWEALAPFAPVDEKALKVEPRVFALLPQIADAVDDARVPSPGRYGADVYGQRDEPLHRPLMKSVVAGIDGVAQGLQIVGRVRHEGEHWARFGSSRNGVACLEHWLPR